MRSNRHLVRFVVVVAALLALALPACAAESLDVLLIQYPTAMMDYVQQTVIPQFETKHNVKVNVLSATWAQRTDKILTLIAAGTAPDVIVTSGYSPVEEGSIGLLEPLDAYIARWPNASRYPKQLWDAVKWQGKVMVIPQNIDIRMMAYNKALFSEAGLDPGKPPQSWDQMISYGKRLTRMNGDKVAVRGITLGYLSPSHAFLWYLRQTGSVEIDMANLASNLDSENATMTAQFIADVFDAGQRSIATTGGDFGVNGEAIAAFNPLRMFNWQKNKQTDVIENLGVFSPRFQAGSTPVSHAFINGLGILAASKKKDLAWEFIALMNDTEHLIKIQQFEGWINGRLDLSQRLVPLLPRIDLIYEQFNYLQSPIIPPPRNASQPPLDTAFTRIYNKQLAPQAAMAEVHAVWTNLIKDWKDKAVK